MSNPLLQDFNVIGWCPVDHFPAPPAVLEFFHRSNAEPIAMSRYGNHLLCEAGLESTFVPLAVDTSVYRPTATAVIGGRELTGREIMDVAEDVFVVGMNAMNKDPQDRKGFNEAFRAFGAFHHDHPDSVLYVHADPNGMGSGLRLRDLAAHSAIPPHAIKFPAVYDIQRSAYTPDVMAALYSSFDVLLSPSHGEGFCVPLVEAQACGTPVIATDFSAQQELVGAGWKVSGQPWWDHAQGSSYVVPFVSQILHALETAYEADRAGMVDAAVSFASRYDADRVFAEHWVPFLAIPGTIRAAGARPHRRDQRGRGHRPSHGPPAQRRPPGRLVRSLRRSERSTSSATPTTRPRSTRSERSGWSRSSPTGATPSPRKRTAPSRSQPKPWVFLCGDDCRATPGWLKAPRDLADRFDVIGTSDAADGRGNVSVQSGKHADHMFVRRAYVDRYGASLDGPGVLCHEGYNHFYVDKELVRLARARNVFSPCLESVVEHLHPGLGKGRSDLVYQSIQSPEAIEDRELYESRLPLIEMQS